MNSSLPDKAAAPKPTGLAKQLITVYWADVIKRHPCQDKLP